MEIDLSWIEVDPWPPSTSWKSVQPSQRYFHLIAMLLLDQFPSAGR